MTETEEINILKKDLKGRQKKIEKLISSDVRHTCEAEHFKDLYLLECKKNCALFLRYKDVNKELALLKNSKEESDDILDKIRAEFISLYPKNYAGEPELGGSSCEFSLNKVLDIIDKYKAESEG